MPQEQQLVEHVRISLLAHDTPPGYAVHVFVHKDLRGRAGIPQRLQALRGLLRAHEDVADALVPLTRTIDVPAKNQGEPPATFTAKVRTNAEREREWVERGVRNGGIGGLVSIGIAIGILLAIFLSFAAAADDEPTTPYLRVSTALDEYRTDDRILVHIESKTWRLDPRTGNVTLAPSLGVVNLTVTDTRHDVVVRQVDIPLTNGTAAYVLYVEPIWSSATVELYAVDVENGVSGVAYIRTEYSMEYAIELLRDVWMRDDDREDARQDAQRDAAVALAWATSVAFTIAVSIIVFLIFLREEQKVADEAGVQSLKERILHRLERFVPRSFVPDDWDVYTDLERTWDEEGARHVLATRERAQVAHLLEVREDLDRAIAAHVAPPPDDDVDVPPAAKPAEG
jgi:hypothetical protein